MKTKLFSKLKKIRLAKIKFNEKKQAIKFKKIKSKLLALTLGIFVISLSLITAVNSIINYNNNMNTLETALKETALVASDQIAAKMEGTKNLIYQIAQSNEFSSDNTKEEVSKKLNDEALLNNFAFMNRTDKAGVSYSSDIDVSERKYFNVCKNSGETYISDPLVSKDTNQKVFIIASPIFKDGVFDGILYAGLNQYILSEHVKQVGVGETGTTYILDKEGNRIASYDSSIIENKKNIIESVKTDKKLKKLAELESDMVNGNSGFGEYTNNNDKKLMAYAPIKGINGWSIAIDVSKKEFFKATYISLVFCVGIALLILVISAIIFIKFAESLSTPIKAINEEMQQFGKGNFSTNFNLKMDSTEIGQLIFSIRNSKKILKEIINDTSEVCKEMSQGNFDIHTKVKYVGEFEDIEANINQTVISLSETLRKIDISAEEVSFGSEQVSSGSQALAKGSTEQAATSEKLSSNITSISEQVSANANNAINANCKLANLSKQINTSNEHMNYLMSVMVEINESSNEIERIIKTIEDIAFETSILALNAAIEAARAGHEGRAFSVVADEVRNLAAKSAEAAKDTESLIEGSIKTVERGLELAKQTQKALVVVVDESKEVTVTVEHITQASNEQAKTLNNITQGMEQIVNVVQSNSATSEEGAAAAEELSGQAQILKDLIRTFKLKNIKDIDINIIAS
ncbi:methyl-accepting chemotaxis protein [Anaerovorax odorimutans]|uniref:methyl-accepting chemotaxis protein n=1 Tax=Anaerovorax odorimutans TaxID=109327 RepID=UPI00041C03AA|nr:methyl-accepting chemotaxis protein [Anaerovorax odorimutans]